MDARPGGFPPPAAAGPVVPAAAQPSSPATTLDTVEAQLSRLPELAVADHVEVFAAIHRQLTDALAVTGGGQGTGGPQQPGRPQPGQSQPGRSQPGQRGR